MLVARVALLCLKSLFLSARSPHMPHIRFATHARSTLYRGGPGVEASRRRTPRVASRRRGGPSRASKHATRHRWHGAWCRGQSRQQPLRSCQRGICAARRRALSNVLGCGCTALCARHRARHRAPHGRALVRRAASVIPGPTAGARSSLRSVRAGRATD